MKGIGKRILALLIVCLLMISSGVVSAFAAGPDLQVPCSVTVKLNSQYAADEDPYAFAIDLYQVACMQPVEGYDEVSFTPAGNAFDDLVKNLAPDENGKYEAFAQNAFKIAMETYADYWGYSLI